MAKKMLFNSPAGFFKFSEKFAILGKVIAIGPKNRSTVKNILLVSFLSLIFLLGSSSTTGVREYRIKKIVIDAGHGGKDPGTHGDFSREKDIALKIALELGTTIKKYLPDVEVIYTRKDDNFIELIDRADIANKNGADLFISIHCNSISNPKIKGTETWVMGLHTSEANLQVAKRENSVILLEESYEENYGDFDPNSDESHILLSLYQSAYLENSLNLAGRIESQFKERVGRHSRGVKQAGFVVLYKTSMPSVLVETGFLTNTEEEKQLNDVTQQSYIASGIFRAFRDYKVEIEQMH